MNPQTDQTPAQPCRLSTSVEVRSAGSPAAFAESDDRSNEIPRAGILIINADDWGRDRENTDRILECVLRRTVSSASAMVFMEDSERAAAIAREHGIDVGLHLNFTTPFSAPGCPSQLLECQRQLSSHLLRHRLAQVVFHPGLVQSFNYVVSAQIDEFRRLYGAAPDRLDGHHHMHLCSNVLLGGLLPFGALVRRNFSFLPGEKHWGNRLYRSIVDGMLARKHRLVDFLFALPPLAPPERLQRIFSAARQAIVEVETHPVNPEEYRFLVTGQFFTSVQDVPISPFSALSLRKHCGSRGCSEEVGPQGH